MEDSEIVALYLQRNDQAIVQTHQKYGGLCMSIAMRILKNRQDSEECVNDTYHHTWNAIPPERPRAMAPYLGRIVRNLALDRYKYNHAGKRNPDLELSFCELEDCIPAEFDPGDGQLVEQIADFLEEQSEQARALFMLRYWWGYSVAELAQRLRMGEGKIKSSLHRTRVKLKAYLQQQGVSV